MEDNFMNLLKEIHRAVKAETYSYYIRDEEKNCYRLKGLLQQAADVLKVRPSYSGLLGYKKGPYQPPLYIPLSTLPKTFEIVKEGEQIILMIPIPVVNALITIAPIMKNIPSNYGLEIKQTFENEGEHK